MDFLVALPTDHQRFASSCRHLFDPYWLFSSSWLFQISELANMMDLCFLFRSAEFTFVGKDSLKEFTPVGHDELRMAIHKHSVLFPFEGKTPKLGHQRFLVVARDNHLQAFSWPMGRFDGDFVLFRHFRDRGPVFARKCLEQRCFRYPVQFVEPVNVMSQEIVLNHSPVLRLILADNAVITVTKEVGSLCWFTTPYVECTFLFNDFFWHT